MVHLKLTFWVIFDNVPKFVPKNVRFIESSLNLFRLLFALSSLS